MKQITIKGKRYYTNILEGEKVNKCIDFLSDGCSSYAISFGNKEKDTITKQNIEGFNSLLLRNMNFDCCFLPERVKDLKDSKEVLKKGLDLIELL